MEKLRRKWTVPVFLRLIGGIDGIGCASGVLSDNSGRVDAEDGSDTLTEYNLYFTYFIGLGIFGLYRKAY